jgi:methylmalonyl-CoA mutase C-terminal domain/subunit
MPARVLVAKTGLDGHDRGAKLIARSLRDAGFEVIYTGLRNRADVIASVAVDEDVDVIGLSILNGAHLSLVRKTMTSLAAAGGDDIKVVVGGTIPRSDIPKLLELGVAAVFPTGTSIAELLDAMRTLTGAAGSD